MMSWERGLSGMELQASIDAITGTRAGFDARGPVVALAWL